MPCGPSAVPTGGAGVAAPAGSWILTTAVTRLRAMVFSKPSLAGSADLDHFDLELCDLAELELDRCLPAEDVHEHLQLQLVLVDLGDLTGEVRERAFLHPDGLADLVFEAGPTLLGGTAADGVAADLEDALPFGTAERGRLRARTYESGDAWSLTND